MADPQRGWLREVFKSEYREVTPEAILLGILFGAFMTASFTYAGMVLGFTLGGSTVAAILGWGVLRAILKKGTIVENNINQTVASGINIAHSGIIFTVPVLYLRNIDFNPFLMLLGTIAGAVLGVAFIIPIRKQMIDLERLRFPTGTAVATILKSPGSGVKKSLYLVYGLAFGGTLYFITQFPLLGLPRIIPETIDLGRLIGLPPYVANVWAISVFALGAGYITGRVGLVVLAGGVLSYWIITPVAVNLGWIPSGAEAIEIAHNNMTRPLGIGMLIGGALTGIIVSSGSIKTALSSLRKMEISGKSPEELPLKFLYSSAIIAFIILFIAAYFTAPIGILKALLIALVGTAWLWFAGIIVAQCTGMTDWSPISGMALVAVILMLFLTRNEVLASVLIGAAVCVAITECADMMQDLKTGYMVGAKPFRQQFLQATLVWIGPIVSLLTIALLWKAYGFGPGTKIVAPQAQALSAAIEGVIGGNVPYDKYISGAIVGAALSASGIPGLGVLVGISMYLPLLYILPYGLGCILNLTTSKIKGKRWTEDWGVPIAAGLLVGEASLVLIFAILIVAGFITP